MNLAVLSAPAYASQASGWATNIEAALETAKKQKKDVLIEFTGSDWCPPCIAMDKQVFNKKEFVEEASKKFVLVEIDIPNGNKELAEKNKPVVAEYQIEGFPTVVLLSSDGKEYSRFAATAYPEVDVLLKKIKQARDWKDLD